MENHLQDKTPNWLRSFIHIATWILIFPFTYLASDAELPLGEFYPAAICFAGSLFNRFALPRISFLNSVFRKKPSFFSGIFLYPFGLGISFLIFPFEVVGLAWSVLAFGDAAAVQIGSRWGREKLAWNARKSWVGSGSFVIAAFIGSLSICFWVQPLGQYFHEYFLVAMMASMIGVLLESFDGFFDDNLRLTLCLSAILWLILQWIDADLGLVIERSGLTVKDFGIAVLANLVFVAGGLLLGICDYKAGLVGGLIGVLFFLFGGLPGYLLMLCFVAGGSLITQIGMKKKKALKVAEKQEGKRGISNAVANLGVAVFCVLAVPIVETPFYWLMASAGALAAALADTVSSELGVLSRSEPRLVTNFKKVKPGTDGAVSTLGLLASLVALLVFSIIGFMGGFGYDSFVRMNHGKTVEGIPFLLMWMITILSSGMLGTLADSFFGAVIENKVPEVGKGTVNFLATGVGALSAGLLSYWFC